MKVTSPQDTNESIKVRTSYSPEEATLEDKYTRLIEPGQSSEPDLESVFCFSPFRFLQDGRESSFPYTSVQLVGCNNLHLATNSQIVPSLPRGLSNCHEHISHMNWMIFEAGWRGRAYHDVSNRPSRLLEPHEAHCFCSHGHTYSHEGRKMGRKVN